MTPGLTQPGDHLAVALDTARFGPVFPVAPRTKLPAISKCPMCKRANRVPGGPEYMACVGEGNLGHGLYDATQDPRRIRTLWGPNPRWMVGIATWGLLVVDIDEEDDTGASYARWLELSAPHGWDDDEAVTVMTPSGGRHLYFEAPEGVTLRNTASKIAPHIDTRASGGYCIAPGSRLPDGRGYELSSPTPAVLPMAPDWLVALLTRQAHRAIPDATPTHERDGSRWGVQALEAELGRLALAAEGTRNDHLVRSAYRVGQLVAGGQLDAHHATSHLLSVAIRIGLTEGEAVATIRSGLAAGAQHPRRPAA